MSEDYTYTTLVNWRTRAHELAATVNTQAARVAELERENAELYAANDGLAAALSAAECDNGRLIAKLDAVPVDAIELVLWGDSTSFGYVEAVGMVGNWLVSVSELTPTAVQP